MNARVGTVTLNLDYWPLEKLLELLEANSGAVCLQLLTEHRARFEKTPGSTHNHQAWPGGYLDHITDCMNYARHQYALDRAIGRPVPFLLKDALLVLFLHDLEKPFRIKSSAAGRYVNREGITSKLQFKQLRQQLLCDYQISLTDAQCNALAYVEGEGADYSSEKRVMGELAAFCHRVDVWSARQCHSYPRADTDEWIGATRFRSA
jgi:hypothetical protein